MREAAEPVPYSRNRPSDAVQLSTSNLPQIDWATVVTPKGNAALFTPQQQQQQPFQQQAFPSAPPPPPPSAPAADDDPFGLLPSAPQLLQSSSFGASSSSSGISAGLGLGRSLSGGSYAAWAPGASQEALSRHALFVPRPGAPGQALLSAAHAQPRLKYPNFDNTPVPQLGGLLGGPGPASSGAASAQPSAPAQPAVGQLSLLDAPAMPRPSAGLALGPQEVQVGGGRGLAPLAPAGWLPGPARPASSTCGPCRPTAPRRLHCRPPTTPQVISVDPASAPGGATCAACPPPPLEPQPAAAPPPPAASPMKEYVRRAALRDVHISVSLMEDFLRFAAANTRRGVESCAILAGCLSANDSVFAVTTLIMPKQTGTSDTVQVSRGVGGGGGGWGWGGGQALVCRLPRPLLPHATAPPRRPLVAPPSPAPLTPPAPPPGPQALNEEEIFEVQFERGLYPLGWIHTHPTQTCFLSSIDMHTQCGYQTMLEEAVAIVMAPTDRSKKCGLFRLSTPGGLGLVQRCTSRGFHSHPSTDTGQDIYELCGHVYLNPRTKHEVIDLR
jgi:hypothetical protein